MSLDPELYEKSPSTIGDLAQYIMFAALLPWQFSILVEEVFKTKNLPQNAFTWMEQNWDEETEVFNKLSVVVEEILLTFASLILAGIVSGVLGIESILMLFLFIRTAGPLSLRIGNQIKHSLQARTEVSTIKDNGSEL